MFDMQQTVSQLVMTNPNLNSPKEYDSVMDFLCQSTSHFRVKNSSILVRNQRGLTVKS